MENKNSAQLAGFDAKPNQGIQLQYVAALAALIVASCGCNSRTQTRRCTDAEGNLIPDEVCEQGGTSYVHGGRTYFYPRWAYGGQPDPANPNRLQGHSLIPASGVRIVNSSGQSVSRGGFGGTGSGRGTFGG